MCCFARPGEVILTYPSSEESFQWERSEEARKFLEKTRDARGRLLKVHKLIHPKPVLIKVCSELQVFTCSLGILMSKQEQNVVPGLRELHDVLAASYINFYMANGSIIMPQYENGAGNDEIAKKQLHEIFPDRTILPVHSSMILCGGGNIHCITQQQPK